MSDTYYATIRVCIEDVPKATAAEFFKALDGHSIEVYLSDGLSYGAEVEKVWVRPDLEKRDV